MSDESDTTGRDIRLADGRWKSGKSGNPGGRPKGVKSIARMIRERGPDLIERLFFWAQSDDHDASIAAIKELLNRGYGKAAEHVNLVAEVNSKSEEITSIKIVVPGISSNQN